MQSASNTPARGDFLVYLPRGGAPEARRSLADDTSSVQRPLPPHAGSSTGPTALCRQEAAEQLAPELLKLAEGSLTKGQAMECAVEIAGCVGDGSANFSQLSPRAGECVMRMDRAAWQALRQLSERSGAPLGAMQLSPQLTTCFHETRAMEATVPRMVAGWEALTELRRVTLQIPEDMQGTFDLRLLHDGEVDNVLVIRPRGNEAWGIVTSCTVPVRAVPGFGKTPSLGVIAHDPRTKEVHHIRLADARPEHLTGEHGPRMPPDRLVQRVQRREPAVPTASSHDQRPSAWITGPDGRGLRLNRLDPVPARFSPGTVSAPPATARRAPFSSRSFAGGTPSPVASPTLTRTAGSPASSFGSPAAPRSPLLNSDPTWGFNAPARNAEAWNDLPASVVGLALADETGDLVIHAGRSSAGSGRGPA